MLYVSEKLSVAVFKEPVITRCVSIKLKNVGYAIKFGDYELHISDYMAQVVNLLGTYTTKEGVFTRRSIESESKVLPARIIENMLSVTQDNTLLVSSLSFYLNGVVRDKIEVDFDEWYALDKKTKLFICWLLSLSSNFPVLRVMYSHLVEYEKQELFLYSLSLIGIIQLNLDFTKITVDLPQKIEETEKISVSSSPETNDSIEQKADISGSDSITIHESKSATKVATFIERSMGNFHKSADEQFYQNLVELVDTTPKYRGLTHWSRILETLRSNPKYRATTENYLNLSGYKLNVNNLRNWYNYYINNTLKTDKFKIISENKELSELITEMNYNIREKTE